MRTTFSHISISFFSKKKIPFFLNEPIKTKTIAIKTTFYAFIQHKIVHLALFFFLRFWHTLKNYKTARKGSHLADQVPRTQPLVIAGRSQQRAHLYTHPVLGLEPATSCTHLNAIQARGLRSGVIQAGGNFTSFLIFS